jgi:predicted phosphodiesterase
MRIQLLSDLHLETEAFDARPAPGAELLLLAGDICAHWAGYRQFARWPVPVLAIAGNHEFDQRELRTAWPALREHCGALGIRLLERETLVLSDRAGRRIRFVATVRWSDFDLFGAAGRERAMRAAGYYVKVMRAECDGQPFDAAAVRTESLACRDWLAAALAQPAGDPPAWDRTVAVTHYAPSLRSADPRYGAQPGSASFCNADDALLALADCWVHGHLHCRHDYQVASAGGHTTRVLSNARGHSTRGEAVGHDPLFCFEV